MLFIAIIVYSTSFAIVAFLPGWRSLVTGAIAASLLVFWMFDSASREDSLGGFVVALFMLLAGLGVLGGFLARATVLAFRARFPKLARVSLVLPAFYVGAIGVISAWVTLEQMRRAPPSLACIENLHAAKLGGTELALPIAQPLRVGLGEEYAPSYLLEINQQAREFCSVAASSPQNLTNLSLQLSRMPRLKNNSATQTLCSRPRPAAWWEAVCRFDKRSSDYPEDMTIYLIGEYNAAKMHANSAISADEYRKRMAGLPVRVLAGGVTMYVGEREVFFTRSGAPGYVARCTRTNSGTGGHGLYCSTGYQLSSELGLAYEFRASEAGFEDRASAIDRGARDIFDSFKAAN